MKNISFLLIALLLSFSFSLFSQSANTDSLILELNTLKGQEKCKVLIEIGEQYIGVDDNQAVHYSRLAYYNCEDKKTKLRAAAHLIEAFNLMRRYDSVDAYVEEALQLSYDLKDDNAVSIYLSERGWKYFYSGDYKKATIDFKASFKIFNSLVESKTNEEEVDSTRFASMTNNLGVAYTKMGQFDSAIYYFYLSLEYKKKYHASPKKITNALVNLSALNIHKNDYVEGKKYAQQALDLAEQNMDSVSLAQSLINLGVCEKNIGDTVQALVYYHRALEIGKSIKRKKTIWFPSNTIQMYLLKITLSKSGIPKLLYTATWELSTRFRDHLTWPLKIIFRRLRYLKS